MSSIGEVGRPGSWETLGDHERRIRALEGVDPCDCPGEDFCNYDAAVVASDNLVGYWPLGETSGDMLDISNYEPSNPADLEYITNGTAATRGVAGPLPAEVDTGAFEQNYAGQGGLTAADYIRLKGSFASGAQSGRFVLSGTSAMAAAAFITPKASASSFIGPVAGWLNVLVGTPPRENGWALRVVWPALTLQFIRCRFVGGVYTETVIDTTLSPGIGYHVFCSYDGTTMRLAVDGVEVDSAASAVNIASTTSDYPVSCGAVKPPAPTADYLGRLYGTQSHTSIWSAAVPLATVQEFLAGCGGGVSDDDMIVYLDGA